MVMIVLLKEAWTCAMPSETLFLTFLRTREAPPEDAFAIVYPLFLQGSSSAMRALAGARVGAGPLTTHGQAAAVTHAAIGSQIDQTLDRQLHFTAQVAFDREGADLFANAFQFGVGEVFHSLGVFDTRGFADLASARTTDSEDRGESDFGVWVRRNVVASSTGHDCSLCSALRCRPLALTLRVARVGTNDTHPAATFGALAVAADARYRCHYRHGCLPVSR